MGRFATVHLGLSDIMKGAYLEVFTDIGEFSSPFFAPVAASPHFIVDTDKFEASISLRPPSSPRVLLTWHAAIGGCVSSETTFTELIVEKAYIGVIIRQGGRIIGYAAIKVTGTKFGTFRGSPRTIAVETDILASFYIPKTDDGFQANIETYVFNHLTELVGFAPTTEPNVALLI